MSNTDEWREELSVFCLALVHVAKREMSGIHVFYNGRGFKSPIISRNLPLFLTFSHGLLLFSGQLPLLYTDSEVMPSNGGR